MRFLQLLLLYFLSICLTYALLCLSKRDEAPKLNESEQIAINHLNSFHFNLLNILREWDGVSGKEYKAQQVDALLNKYITACDEALVSDQCLLYLYNLIQKKYQTKNAHVNEFINVDGLIPLVS